ncbi:MAG TPA: cyclodeaminase/cyclohydrolase family protein [Gaiellales bacterium]|nr:cyclodeaminase/cyclohydrolase family protein [Gaiellales bacterium]
MGSSSGSSSDSDVGSEPYLTTTLAGFLDRLAARTPAPGGGSVAAVTCAMAAGLVEMAAAFDGTGMLDPVGARAHELRARAAALADADGAAYAQVLAALRMPAGPERTARLDVAVAGAIDCPMRVLEIAAEVATLAADVAAHGNRNLEGDAITGAVLAEAAARSAATLAQLNVSMLSRHAMADAHLERLRPGLACATRARERAVESYAHAERG